MKVLQEPRIRLSGSGAAWTLPWVVALSFLTTGALLFGWDLIEHAYLPGASNASMHRMHVVRGISTAVLVSAGIASLLLWTRIGHERQKAKLNRELIRQERLAAVGELAGGFGPELLNPLTGIEGALTVVAQEIPPDDEIQEAIGQIQQQVRRMEHLVVELLTYARPGQLRREWIDLHSILRRAAASVRHLPSLPKADVVLDLDPRVPEIYADPREFEYAFENLIHNAYQAIPEGGRIEVRTRRVRDRIHISVSDDGLGIEDDVRDKIFEPFFTTKAGGTGLGLSLVHRAVENHGGEITVHSTPGNGATFDLVLSTKQGPMERAPAGLERAL